ncbi:Vms1/Ankzf1 family peptidyl-tRNA hydrolase [Streptomyces sp. V4-01]|uniref:Vms1/Ankzf1 family peptidyl-tRNA hydrolase n=1 Tax=Actinacidiphila polyblastidii TaxID=3110430 RepID=A0ABU7P8D4_9ACTN|nr:Vms1/Ankzf1 family peptidyl-tRNA hydrolase [Streptomyces sp. V4-01]
MELTPFAPLYERTSPWAAVYLDTSAGDAAAWEQTGAGGEGGAGFRARGIGRELARQGADEATCRAVVDAADSCPHTTQPAGRVIFASSGKVAFDLPLTMPPPGGWSATWSRLPHVAPLLELVPDEPDCLVAHVDRTGADFELRTAAGSGPAGGGPGGRWPPRHGSTGPGHWSQRHFHLNEGNTWEENARAVAEEIQDFVVDTGAGLVVLAGGEPERHAVHDHLPPPLRTVVVEAPYGDSGPYGDPPPYGDRAAGARTPRLDADVRAARQDYLRRRSIEELSRFESACSPARGHAGAAEGVPALVEAAREHRIERLLLAPDAEDAHRALWAGPEPHQLALRRGDAAHLGDAEPFAARADDVLLRAAAVGGAEGVWVGARAHGHPEGGLGALLRWTF